MTVAVLYAYADGPYAGLDGVDVWDVTRDARTYAGPHPVVAHPPCERWGRYWTCCVEQGHYGHRARKATWLYAVGCDLPSLRWGTSSGGVRLDYGFHSAEERAAAKAAGWVASSVRRMTGRENAETPTAFRDVLLSMARGARAVTEAA